MSIETPSTEYILHSEAWEHARDCAAGPIKIKHEETKYLPKGKMTDEGYRDYLKRALFVGYVSRILTWADGQLLRNSPQAQGLPEYFVADVDLCGTTLSNFIGFINRELQLVSRVGLWMDYSVELSRPYITPIRSENIIKWNYEVQPGGEKVLSSVVLEVCEETIDDSFDVQTEKKWIALYLNADGFFQKDTYKKNDKGKIIIESSEIPTAGVGGKPFEFIPFVIVSAHGSSEHLHMAPMFPIVEVNLALYRAMASREQLLFYYGNPTLIAKGWDEKRPFPLGGIAAFGESGGAEFVQVAVEGAVDQAIKDKKEEIAQLGSSFLSGRGRYVSSATTAEVNQEGDNASLSAIANVISESLSKVFGLIQTTWGADIKDPSVRVNTKFEEPELISGELTEIVNAMKAGGISFDTVFYNLKKNKFYPDDADVPTEKQRIIETMKLLQEVNSSTPGYDRTFSLPQ